MANKPLSAIADRILGTKATVNQVCQFADKAMIAYSLAADLLRRLRSECGVFLCSHCQEWFGTMLESEAPSICITCGNELGGNDA